MNAKQRRKLQETNTNKRMDCTNINGIVRVIVNDTKVQIQFIPDDRNGLQIRRVIYLEDNSTCNV